MEPGVADRQAHLLLNHRQVRNQDRCQSPAHTLSSRGKIDLGGVTALNHMVIGDNVPFCIQHKTRPQSLPSGVAIIMETTPGLTVA